MRLTAFVLLTVGTVALVAACVKSKAGGELRDLDEYVYFAILFGFGSLQAVLHSLASTVGISFLSVAASLLVIDVALCAWLLSRPGRAPMLRPPLLALPGIVVILALLLQWYDTASVSLRITGSDAAHYHIPHAANFANGGNLFGFLATPHLYPMGASVWGAWLLQAALGPAMLDLMTLPATLLLIASLGLLFRAGTDQPGIVWAPWLALLMLGTPLLRVSMLPSADLLYAAAFVALFAQSFLIWRTGAVRGIDLLGLACASGLLVSSKAIGLASMILIIAVWSMLLAARRLSSGQWRLDVRAGWGVVIASAVAIVLTGGIWMIRNWLLFGSPLAPSGLTVLGQSIFPGDAYLEGGYYHSVLKDMRDIEGYRLSQRFGLYAKRLIGPWFVPAAILIVLFCADFAVDWKARRRSGRLTETTAAKVALIIAVSLLAAAHAALLIPAPWTSLEWTRGLALRYVLPLLILYLTLMALFLFPAGLPRWHTFPVARIGIAAAIMSALFLRYLQHSVVPGLPRDEWFPVFQPTMLAIAAVVVIPSFFPGPRPRLTRGISALVLACTLIILSYRGGVRIERLRAESLSAIDALATAGPADAEYRCAYARVLAFERQMQLERRPRRFFVASRFDLPLELQGPDLENMVFDVRGRTERAALLGERGPGTGPRDYLVIDAREHDGMQSQRVAFRIAVEAGLEHVGDCGRYNVYYVRRNPRARPK